MDEDIDEKAHQMTERYVASPRHTVEVDYMEYCNTIADKIGCRPNLCEKSQWELLNILNRFIFSKLFIKWF